MVVKSPIANFAEVLKKIRQTAQTYGAKFITNEAATRAALIDPIIGALGWDTTNPDMVEFERKYGNTRVDYAFMDCNGKVVAIIEAKAMGGNLTSPAVTMQILSYGFNFQLKNVLLTDGIIWHYYSYATPGANTPPETIDLSTSSLFDCANFFINKLDAFQFWPGAVSGQTTTVSVSSGTPTTSVLGPLPPTNPTSTVAVPPTNTKFYSLATLPQYFSILGKPKFIRLPDGTCKPIQYWRDILEECVDFVLQNNTAIPIPLLDKSGKKINLLSDMKPVHKVAMKTVTYNGKTVYIHLNYDSNNCIANAIHILRFLPNNQVWQGVEVA